MTNCRRLRAALLACTVLLLIACAFGRWLDAQLNQQSLDRRLVAALVHNDGSEALALVNEGADPNTRYAAPHATLRQLLERLLRHSRPPVNNRPTALLMACGAPWLERPDGTADWFQASDEAAEPLVAAMLRRRPDVNARTVKGETALHLAARNHRARIAWLLLEHGVAVNAQDRGKWTALCYALESEPDKRIVGLLLAHGANPNLTTDDGDRAISIAKRRRLSDMVALLRKYGAVDAPPDPPTVVPAIARLLGVRAGYNGQDALTHMFGDGLHTIGGHPGGRVHWSTRNPAGEIEAEGFNYNHEGEVLEDLSWELAPVADGTVPFVRRLPRRAGWLGVIYPGMTVAQVSQLTARSLPPPQKQANTWTWTAKGFVRPSHNDYDIYTHWTAQLTFENGRLDSIDVTCDGGRLAPSGQ